jgi:hypothetical protein
MFLKAEYLFGSRPIEVAGELTSSDRLESGLTVPFGPRGTDCWLAETDAPDMTNTDFVKILVTVVTALALQTNLKEAILGINKTIDKLTEKIPVAIFKVKIAKQHMEKGEEVPFRLVALPLIDEYEPWAKELYEYFKAAGNNYVFPFNRQDVWDYITRKEKIFEGLTYRIKKYVNSKKKPEVITLDQLKAENNGVLEKLLTAPANALGIAIVQADRFEYKLEANGRITRKESYAVFSHPKPLKNSGLHQNQRVAHRLRLRRNRPGSHDRLEHESLTENQRFTSTNRNLRRSKRDVAPIHQKIMPQEQQQRRQLK